MSDTSPLAARLQAERLSESEKAHFLNDALRRMGVSSTSPCVDSEAFVRAVRSLLFSVFPPQCGPPRESVLPLEAMSRAAAWGYLRAEFLGRMPRADWPCRQSIDRINIAIGDTFRAIIESDVPLHIPLRWDAGSTIWSGIWPPER